MNFLLFQWKLAGQSSSVHKMLNPMQVNPTVAYMHWTLQEARTIQTIETQNWVWLGTKVLHFTWKTSLILITEITATGFTSTQIAPPILTNVFQLQATNHSSEHKKHAKVGVQEDTHSMQGETHTHTATPDDMVSISTDSSKKDYRNNS